MEYVTSADGTRIGYERGGSGPPVVLVHGSLNDRNVWGMVAAPLRERFTVYAMDRRGRGESSQPAEHAIEREYEDVLAVVEAAGEPVGLVGHSYGARCALGAAMAAPERVRALVLYEPPPTGEEALEMTGRFESMEPADALTSFLGELAMEPEEIKALRATPFWSYMLRFTASMPVEGRAMARATLDAGALSTLRMPVLLLVGSRTRERLAGVMEELASHLPQARWHEFEAQGHAAMLTAPAEFAQVVREFLEA